MTRVRIDRIRLDRTTEGRSSRTPRRRPFAADRSILGE